MLPEGSQPRESTEVGAIPPVTSFALALAAEEDRIGNVQM